MVPYLLTKSLSAICVKRIEAWVRVILARGEEEGGGEEGGEEEGKNEKREGEMLIPSIFLSPLASSSIPAVNNTPREVGSSDWTNVINEFRITGPSNAPPF